jgi:NAD(P)-dependent dehydrogenase (short-subunit alcohol dehydrogenase family)
MELLKGKTILVTGVCGELGKAAAALFAQAGAEVIGTAREQEEGANIIDAINADGGKAHFIAADVANEQSVASLFETIKAKHNSLHGAFNAAGVQPIACSMPDMPMDDLELTMTTNARGTFLCLQHELRMMNAQGYGSVVNVSSIGGTEAIQQSAAYCASQFGIVGMTRTAALDMAEAGIRVNSLSTGAYNGAGTEARVSDLLANHIPMKRLADAKEIAAAGMFLLSDQAAYITGQSIAVDGGITAGIVAV